MPRKTREPWIVVDKLNAGELFADTGDIAELTVDLIHFDTTATPPTSPVLGDLWVEDDVLNFASAFEDVVAQLPFELWVDVRNESGGDISNGEVVYAVGNSGNRRLIALAQADSDTTSCVLAVATHDIDDDNNGVATTFGLVRDIDTTGTPVSEVWGEGERLYLSPTIAGGLTNVAPTAPDELQPIGEVGRVHATQGNIMVRISSGSVELNGRYVLKTGDTMTGNLIIDSSTLRVGDETNNASWAVDGTLTLNGTATVWDDLLVPVSAIARLGFTDPDWVQVVDDGSASIGVYALGFDDGPGEEEIYFTVQIPHTWKEGSTIYPHVHWGPALTGGGNVVWGLEYTWQSIGGGAFPNSTIITGTGAAGVTANVHLLTSIGAGIDGSGETHSSMLLCRLFRDTSGADTLTGDAILYEVDFHYEINALGDATQPGV